MFGYSLTASGKIKDSRPLKKKGWKKRIKKNRGRVVARIPNNHLSNSGKQLK